MAVDYFHRLVVWGSPTRVAAFAASARRRVRYPSSGRTKGRSETVSFSFRSLWRAHPTLTRVFEEPPFDPYHVRAWRPTRETGRLSFTRYQFQTRNMEMDAIVRGVSRECPHLSFVLMTLCLDVSSIESWLMQRGRTRHYTLPEPLLASAIDAEAARRGLTDDSDGDAWQEVDDVAEDTMMTRALTHWDRALFGSAPSRPGATRKARSSKGLGRYRRNAIDWWDAPDQRDRLAELPLLLELDTRGDPALRQALGFDRLDRARRGSAG